MVLGQPAHEVNFKQMAGTQTLVVPDRTAQLGAASDYPLRIVLDSSHTIRFIGRLPADAFNGDGSITKMMVNSVRSDRAIAEPSAEVPGGRIR
jgi:hypothetical protein